MKPFDPHIKSRQLRRFKPTRQRAGIFCVSIVFVDTAMLALAFFLLVSPFVIQPGINIKLPTSPLSGGTHFGNKILSITRNGEFYFNDERVAESDLLKVFRNAVIEQPRLPLIIEADEQVTHGKVIIAWNAALQAGIQNVFIATQIAALTEETSQ